MKVERHWLRWLYPKLKWFDSYTDRAKRAIYYSKMEAERRCAYEIATEHILIGLMYEDPELFEALSPDPDIVCTLRSGIEPALNQKVARRHAEPTSLPLSYSGQQVVLGASAESNLRRQGYVGTEHLLLAVLRLSTEGDRWFFGLLKGYKAPFISVLNENGFTASTLRHRIAGGSLTPQNRGAALAARLLAQNRKYYIERHQYRAALPSEFPKLDVEFYDQSAAALEREGFSVIGDFEDMTASNAYPEFRRFYRALTGDGGAIVALITHSRGSDLYEYVRCSGKRPARDLSKSVECYTEFGDGSIVITTSAREQGLSSPGRMERHYVPADLTATQVLDTHRARLTERARAHREVVPLLIRTVDELEQQRHRITDLTAEHRRPLGGGLTKEELSAMFKNQGEEFIEVLYQRVQELSDGREGQLENESQS